MTGKSTAFFLALALAFSGAAKAEAAPPLYEVRDDAGHALYLVGTMHVGDASILPLDVALNRAFSDADVLVVELDLLSLQADSAAMAGYRKALTFENGDRAARHLSAETVSLAVEKLGLPPSALDALLPAAWVSQAEQAIYGRLGLSAEFGLDAALLRMAHESGKPVEELETLDDQSAVLLALPDSVADYELRAYLEDEDAAMAHFRALYDAWYHGDEAALTALFAEEDAAVPEALRRDYQAYESRVREDRNAAFAAKAAEYLASGRTALFAVGAAHVVGDDALAERLARAGYQVRAIAR